MNYKEKYNLWLNSNYIDKETKEELKCISSKDNDIKDRFYRELEFGTGGLRGVIAAGSNRMNIYTVRKATQGLANYLKNKYEKDISVAIAYDSRIMSKEFAKTTAEVLSANNISVNIFSSLRPTPMLSYSVRYLKCKAGICITASHNPKEYNGYKVYGEDGGQITDECAKEILDSIEKIKDFSEIKIEEFEEGIDLGKINYIKEEIDKTYYERVKDLVIRKDMVKNYAKDLNIIYTPLHGAGNIPVRRVLSELGFNNLFVVKEQELPDGNFPTVPYPNPEIHEVFNIGIKMAEKINPDIIFGTDPDCDRIGIVVRDSKGLYKVLTGNQVGVLLSHYILTSLKEKNSIFQDDTIIKTIVTTDMVKKIAKDFNVNVLEVLTGFKYIGEKIKEFEENKKFNFIFGFEESYGYLRGSFVRDKDAVIGAALICEMTLYYKKQGISLYDALMNLYEKYGYFKEELVSLELKGIEGKDKIDKILHFLRHSMSAYVNGKKITRKVDYKLGIDKDILNIKESLISLPKSNVIKFILDDNSWFVVRPSGTEPKIKIYFSVVGSSNEEAENKLKHFKESVMNIIHIETNCS
ncbi:phosphoglucomutase [Clostridium tetanomorphum]|uniref:Phosphoglucomutase n=1 Tax=Clostridium tetanomorphum TaxID=1553 RepID=A0A923EDX0_CLOTT|nr:phospho-sugar mutase [Clostridium tetanomorphum]KAJ49415.1 phosphoglucomutase [Clostridium tetanomorphum DSM 665]KAJ52294.1 phosphoglucomutase [Clostridium tetanomorphum DSM 665]MBC2399539.1 phospho-sugar mutase [Clostridium tetanomorphum]MBP1866321.1 phosphoglucomutase [Clostridium tetanomorphum]NRS85812.1 phosphoglucomutase [Clostridium tetanomorphum]